MPELAIDSFLLVRSPAYSYEKFTEIYLKKILQTDFFRAALFFASQTFYIELKKKNFDYEELNVSSKLTLWKYFNRMCFRPLPYGLFSSYSAAGWSVNNEEGLVFTADGELVVHPDFKVVYEYVGRLNTAEFSGLKYYNNNSIYQSGRQLRFISQAYTAQNKFVIVQLKVVPGLKKLLNFISKGRTKSDILKFLTTQYGEESPVNTYFDSLKEGQLIVSELTANVTGQNYNQRCFNLLQKYPVANLKRLESFTTVLNSQVQHFPILTEYIDELLSENSENASYSLYERKVTGGLQSSIKNELIALVENMDKLTADIEIGLMNTFKAKFTEKYEQREVPLMEVLDPGQGIGYENLTIGFDEQNDGFLEGLKVKPERTKNARWGLLERMIFKKWANLSLSGLKTIHITSDELKDFPQSDHSLPPGMYVLFKRLDGLNWIDHVGGVSGVELSSRFGAAGTAIEKKLRAICKKEMEINKEFIFAEIAFSPNDRTSNINQRGTFYNYEIPVLTYPSTTDEFTITLNDLMISVIDNKIFLRSVRLDKYVIPRLSSAYNYQLGVIPVFRFLCDLQFQGVKSGFSFSLMSLFPEMDYYPRVQLENAVISPATWVLNEQQLKLIIEGDGRFLKEDLQLPTYFSLHEGDNFLVFNKESAQDLEIFKRCLRNKKTVKLTEYVFAEKPGLQNQAGEPFASQLIACVINQNKSYVLPNKSVKKLAKGHEKVKRSFLPGEEWLYLKLYTHYTLTDEILLTLILPVIRKYKKDNPGFKWFFIRYQDPDHHLRLRFFTASKSSYALLADLIHKLQPLSREGKIADVMLDTYQRELEKYSPECINEVEVFFYCNSEFILKMFLNNELSSAFKLSFAVNVSLKLIACFIDNVQQRDEFFSAVFQNLSTEFNKDKEIVRKMDIKYRKFQQELINRNKILSVQENSGAYRCYLTAAGKLAEKIACWEQNDQYNLLINLVHVQINRIFEVNPREYEYLIYHFMKKHQSYLKYNVNG